EYRTVASAGWLRDRRRGLPVLHPAARRVAREPRRFCAGCCPARLAAARPLRAASAGPALGNIEPRTILDDADHHLARCSARANRSLPLFPAPELSAGDRRDRDAAPRFRGD